jgi:hypothetical protein
MRARAAAILSLTLAAGVFFSPLGGMLRAQEAPAKPADATADKPAAGGQSTAPSATRLVGVQVGSNADGIVVTLRGNGRLAYGSMTEADTPPARLVIDLQGVRPDVPPSTPGRGVLRRIRVALNNPEPLVTRVVLDLERMVGHRIRPSADGREVSVTLESAAGEAPERTAAAAPVEKAPASRPARTGATPKASP